MAPKASKGKPNKGKGEKKKEEKVLPTVIEIVVETPEESQLTLKGISTDKILDVRKLLAVHVESCYLTNYSLSHEVRGPRLKDSVEIASLKPCHLTVVEEDYTEDLAVAHVRRLLDIVACTTTFGGSSNPTRPEPNGPDSTNGESGSPEKPDPTAEIYPQPKLGQFYDFFSFALLTPPVQYIKRSARPFVEEKTDDDFFQIDVRIVYLLANCMITEPLTENLWK
ncbi:protein REDUCED CHLOROPLAST COVERAGE 2-like [Bidens hawaiensis]|uniref:protein REDUCED CHLOROPLAST COVERAGE 2-like n=1 Tax=Bidens hawaiensis TaxID=980011 RepID=UPI00404914E0